MDNNSWELIRKEITELHLFFENWFNGTIKEDITRFSTVIDPHFVLITPTAEKLDHDMILRLIREGYNTTLDRKIWTENIEVITINDIHIATYHELQKTDNKETRRISSAIFRSDPKTVNSVKWVHVHETWVN